MKVKNKILKKNSSLPLHRWVLAVAMALVAVSAIAMVLTSTWIAASENQDLRSYAAEPVPEARVQAPVVTSIKVDSATDSATMTEEESNFGGLRNITNTDSSGEEKEESNSNVFLVNGNAPAGVRIIYVLLGLGVLIGGLAFGLILLVKKVLGSSS